MMALCLAAWSAMTVICGLTKSLPQLLLARIGVGISEAGGGPAAMSMIGDLYPPERRATAISIFYLASPLGAFLSFAAAGHIAAHYGWRSAFLIGGAPGLLLAILMFFTVTEPMRGRSDPKVAQDPGRGQVPASSTSATLRFFRSQRSLVYVVVGMTVQIFVLSGVSGWIGSFFIRRHGFGVGEIGPLLGTIIGACSLVGTLSGGLIVDRLARRDQRWRCWTLAIAAGLTAPSLLATFLLPDRYASVGAFACASLFNSVWYGPGFGLCQSLVGSRMRGTIAALMYFCSNLIGFGLGGQSIGLLSDLLSHRVGSDSLRYALLAVSTADVVAAACFFLAAPRLQQELLKAAAA
jgi:MFS family permease